MTRKQIKNVVNELVNLELAHDNPALSKEEKQEIESRMTKIFARTISKDNTLGLALEIDALVQEKLNSIKNKEN